MLTPPPAPFSEPIFTSLHEASGLVGRLKQEAGAALAS
jgi:hypothetical protein